MLISNRCYSVAEIYKKYGEQTQRFCCNEQILQKNPVRLKAPLFGGDLAKRDARKTYMGRKADRKP
jgi:hypothetical protein